MPKTDVNSDDKKDKDKADTVNELSKDDLLKLVALQDSKIKELDAKVSDLNDGVKALIDQLAPVLRAMKTVAKDDSQPNPNVPVPDQKGAVNLLELVKTLTSFVQPQDKSGQLFYNLGVRLFENVVQNQQLNNRLMEAVINRVLNNVVGNVSRDITEMGMKE